MEYIPGFPDVGVWCLVMCDIAVYLVAVTTQICVLNPYLYLSLRRLTVYLPSVVPYIMVGSFYTSKVK